MKYDVLQGDIIKKLYSVNPDIKYYLGPQGGEIWAYDKFTAFKIPMFFCYIAFPPSRELVNDLVRQAWNYKEPTSLVPFRMEIINGKKSQILHNAETGEEIKLNTTLYSKYITRDDEATFWGTDRKSPVFIINGPVPDRDNIIAMVLPFV